MRRNPLWMVLLPVVLFPIALTLLGAGLLIQSRVKESSLPEQTARNWMLLERLREPALELLENRRGIRREKGCPGLKAPVGIRLTLVLPDGKVFCDTEATPYRMENQGEIPEVESALGGARGERVFYEPGLGRGKITVYRIRSALPLPGEKGIIGALMLTGQIGDEEGTGGFWPGLIIPGVALLGLAGLSLWWSVRKVVEPLEELGTAMVRLADGSGPLRVPVAHWKEAVVLSESFRWLAEQTSSRIGTLTRRQDEMTNLLDSMVEAVLAVNDRERILDLNPAAARLFDVEAEQVRGRLLLEVVRHPELLRFVTHALKVQHPVDAELMITAPQGQLTVQAQGTTLREQSGRAIGALIVLHDVTRLRQLEGIRRDFVANVSHELKTPITSIKGFVETLQDGALHNREEAERFLGIMAKQADRLQAIIEDLLNLSRIEEDGEKGNIHLETEPILPVIEAAIQDCRTRIEDRGIRIQVTCPSSLTARVNAPLLEQALVNLIENAIRYGRKDSEVMVTAASVADKLVVQVRDEGQGIPESHLPRLFERFYRVDQARSRELGGTGLGLAIVKHIAQAHGGSVSVTSQLGEGSAFTISLPQAGPSGG